MTPDTLVHRSGVPVLACAPDGQKLRGEGDAVELIAAALQHGADVVLLPAGRLTDEFFTLRTGLAGEIVQKFVNYRLRLAIVGDVSRRLAESSALRDFVSEANRGNHVWFVATVEDLDARLQRGRRVPR